MVKKSEVTSLSIQTLTFAHKYHVYNFSIATVDGKVCHETQWKNHI